MSVASLARTTGVTGEPSSTRSRASCSPLDAEVSMMSTDSSRTRAVIASKYSWRERRRGGVWPGAMPAAATPKAMSASLASAMMKSSCVYPPAKIVASLRSSAFMVSLFPSVPQDDLAVIRFTTTRSDPGGSVDQLDDAPGVARRTGDRGDQPRDSAKTRAPRPGHIETWTETRKSPRDTSNTLINRPVSYTHLTLPTNREV